MLLFQWFNKFLSEIKVELSCIVSMLYNKLSNIFHIEAPLFHNLPRHVFKNASWGYVRLKNNSKLKNTSIAHEALKICFSQKGLKVVIEWSLTFEVPKGKLFVTGETIFFYFTSIHSHFLKKEQNMECTRKSYPSNRQIDIFSRENQN